MVNQYRIKMIEKTEDELLVPDLVLTVKGIRKT